MMQTASMTMSGSVSKLLSKLQPISPQIPAKDITSRGLTTPGTSTYVVPAVRLITERSRSSSIFTAPSHQFASSSYGRRSCTTVRATASPVLVNTKAPGAGGRAVKEVDDRVLQIHSVDEFERALDDAKSRLVVVEYAALHSENSKKIYPAMVDLSRTCQDTVFLLVLGDETDDTKELCVRAGIEKVPHFTFYKNKEVIHEEEGIDAEQLQGDVLYYGNPDAPIHQLHGRADFESLLQQHKSDSKLVIVDVGLKNCGPCVKVYPTFIKLSKRLADAAVFARLHGDESDDCMELLKTMGVVEVPTFLFIKDGKLCGRYVGSGKGELIGEILRHSGVQVT